MKQPFFQIFILALLFVATTAFHLPQEEASQQMADVEYTIIVIDDVYALTVADGVFPKGNHEVGPIDGGSVCVHDLSSDEIEDCVTAYPTDGDLRIYQTNTHYIIGRM